MTVQAQYAAKRVTPAEAIRNVHNGDTIVVPTGVAEPPALLNALSEHRRDFRDVKVSQILAVRKFGYLDPSTAEHVRHVAYFFSGASRPGFKEGVGDFYPSYFSEMPISPRSQHWSRTTRLCSKWACPPSDRFRKPSASTSPT